MGIHDDHDESEKFLNALRLYLKNLRQEKGLTQVQLARLGHNQHQSAIARLESGSTLNVGIKVLYEIAKGTEMPLWKIIKQAEAGSNLQDKIDEWDKLSQTVSLLPPRKRQKFTKLVGDMLEHLTDN